MCVRVQRLRRFIVHNDANNPMLQSLEKFDSALKSFSPHLIIVSGLQMMDNFPFEPGLFNLLLSRYQEICKANKNMSAE